VEQLVDKAGLSADENVICFAPPPTFRGTNTYYVLDLLNNDRCSTAIKHNNAE